MNPQALGADNSVLLVIDIQDKLLAKIPNRDSLVRNVGFLMDVAKLMDIPILVTEQYPKGLGPTTAALADRLSKTDDLISKTAFSCCGSELFRSQLVEQAKQNVIVAGMETHVCVAQTVRDLIQLDFQPVLPIDSLGSRFPIDHEVALRRMEKAGATLTTVESIAFEWVGDAADPRFKALSQLVIARSAENP